MTTEYIFIDTSEQLEEYCDKAAAFPWLAVDTEFIREKTYFPQWCLLQLATPESIACIDVLAITDMSPAMDLMYNPDIVKLFHAASQDMEIFHLAGGKPPAPIFDTQLAAALSGHGDQIGYANLVQRVMEVNLEKGHSRCDWSRRPLSKGELAYAADDVVHLGPIYKILTDELQARGRLEWLQVDLDSLTDPSRYTPDPDNAWRRLKGLGRLKPQQQQRAAKLAKWRETEAIERNRPRKWILSDGALNDLSRRPPQSLDDMSRLREMSAETIKRHGETLLEILAETGLPEGALVEDKRILQPEQEPVVDLLMACLRQAAQKNELATAALGKRADLEKLVAGDRETALLKGWRKVAVGDDLLKILDGKVQASVNSGRLHFK